MADSDKASKTNRAAPYRNALLGAILAQLLVLLLVFLWGAVFGASGINFLRTGPTAYGIAGGMNALGFLLIVYEATLGVAALVVSAIGAGIALATGALIRARRAPPPDKKSRS